MDVDDAAQLIRDAFRQDANAPVREPTWADLGAGSGTFTLALARLLGPGATIHAIDSDPRALASLQRLAGQRAPEVTIVPRRADLSDDASWRAAELPPLNGALMANTLHFVPEPMQTAVLARVAERIVTGGLLVIVEYADRMANRWVPYPVSPSRLHSILPPSLGDPREIGRRRSEYGGTMYAAVTERV